MFRISFRFLFLFISSFVFVAHAQNTNDKVVFSSLNQSFMKELLLKKLNFIRDTLKVSQLGTDDFLIPAGDMHVKYMIKTAQVTNLEEGKLATVEDRVNSIKGNYGTLGQLSAAANVGKTTFLKKENKKVTYETYEEVAEGITKDIFNYKSNLKYLDNENFSNVCITLGVDEPGKKIYAVYILANKPYLAPNGIKISENAFSIKPYNDEKCANAKSNLKKLPPTVKYGIVVENGKFYFYMNDLNWFTKIFEESVDAISYDLIHKSQYGCEGSNIQHKSPIHDGVIMPIVNAKALIKSNLRAKEGQMYAPLAVVPSQINASEYEVNVIFLKSKCRCAYAPKQAFVVDSLNLLTMGLFVDTLNPDNEIYKKDNSYRFNYQFNTIKSSNIKIDSIYQALGASNTFQIKNINVQSYYPFQENEVTAKENIDALLKSLKTKFQQKQQDSISFNYTVLPNWEAFYTKIVGSKYENLLNKSRDYILNEITNNSDLKNYIQDLNKQGYEFNVSITTNVKRIVKPRTISELKPLIEAAIAKENASELESILKEMYSQIFYGSMDKSELSKIEIPVKSEFANALLGLSAIKYIYQLSTTNSAYDEFLKLSTTISGNKYLAYNMTVLNCLKYFESKDKQKSFDPVYADIQNLLGYNLDKSILNKLNANFFFMKAYKEQKNNKFKVRDEAIKNVSLNLTASNLSDINLNTTILNYAYFDNNEQIINLINKSAFSEFIDSQVLLNFVKYTIISDIEKKNIVDLKLALENLYTHTPNKSCEIFDSQFGSFQLKNSSATKSFYCTHCNK
ncbi:MAG: hypothetical protein U0V72_05640 [Cytophagales bacterium]